MCTPTLASSLTVSVRGIDLANDICSYEEELNLILLVHMPKQINATLISLTIPLKSDLINILAFKASHLYVIHKSLATALNMTQAVLVVFSTINLNWLHHTVYYIYT